MADDNVIQGRFQQRKEEVWTCNCGCQLYVITAHGYAKCNACSSPLNLEWIVMESKGEIDE